MTLKPVSMFYFLIQVISWLVAEVRWRFFAAVVILGVIALHKVTQNPGTGGTMLYFEFKLPRSSCLTMHSSGWSVHTGKRLIFLANAQFEAVGR